MSNDPLQTEKLINYIDGNMQDAEKTLLQKQLQTDETMQQELDDLLLARDVVKNYGLANRVSAIHTKMMKEMAAAPTRPKAQVRNLYTRMIKYAAVAILLVGLFSLYQYMNISAGKLYNQQYTAYSLTTFRANETMLKRLRKLMQKKRYNEVIAEFKKQADASVKETFIAGQSYLAKENYAEAVTCFKTVLLKNSAANTGILLDDAEYYLALSYLKIDEPKDALALFKKIKNNNLHLYNNKISYWFLKKYRY